MAGKKVGTLIREARTEKKLSQEQLASGIDGLSGSDIGKAERGEKELTQAQLKAIAKTLGITQKSLLEAPKGGSSSAAASAKTGAAKKTAASSKTGAATEKKTASSPASAAKKTSSAKTSSAKKTSSTAKTASASSLSAAEKKLIELYREASSDNKKLATKILKGEGLSATDLLPMLGGDGGGLLGMLQGLIK